MGQKVHPYGFRLGVNKPWRSRWFSVRDYAKLLIEDVKLKTELKEKLKAAGAEVVIVSASAENWLQQWCSVHQLQLMGTRLEIKNDLVTGKIENLNCHGKEKVNRINAAFDLSQYSEIYCYGDTKGDKPMLELATFSFYKPFR